MAAAGAQLDVDQHDWIIPEDEDDCTAPEPPGHIMAQQQEMFWQGENMSRVRNGAMTPYERLSFRTWLSRPTHLPEFSRISKN